MSQVEKDVEAALQNVSVYLQIRFSAGLFIHIIALSSCMEIEPNLFYHYKLMCAHFK